mmetsp:Transcript_13427/g.25655  ORF Transcript_13427/g.25655 Transcript_13427/m.25655 type:complete len:85 (-) Transcript_13427:1416-1670(-)
MQGFHILILALINQVWSWERVRSHLAQRLLLSLSVGYGLRMFSFSQFLSTFVVALGKEDLFLFDEEPPLPKLSPPTFRGSCDAS